MSSPQWSTLSCKLSNGPAAPRGDRTHPVPASHAGHTTLPAASAQNHRPYICRPVIKSTELRRIIVRRPHYTPPQACHSSPSPLEPKVRNPPETEPKCLNGFSSSRTELFTHEGQEKAANLPGTLRPQHRWCRGGRPDSPPTGVKGLAWRGIMETAQLSAVRSKLSQDTIL